MCVQVNITGYKPPEMDTYKTLKLIFQMSEEWLSHSLNCVKNIWLIIWGKNRFDLPPHTTNLN